MLVSRDGKMGLRLGFSLVPSSELLLTEAVFLLLTYPAISL